MRTPRRLSIGFPWGFQDYLDIGTRDCSLAHSSRRPPPFANAALQFRITNYGKPGYEGRTVRLKSLEFTFWPVPLEKRNPGVRFLTDLLT